MRIPLLIFYLFAVSAGFAQSARHAKVAGTKCSLIPPEGFVPASNFSGFQNAENGASIMVSELPAPYAELSKAFTADALKSKGMKLIAKETIDFNQGKATFLTVSQEAGGTNYLKQILMFGDADKTVMINGIYPEAIKVVEPQIKASLLSTVYDAAQPDDPLAAANFSIEVSGTNFKFAKYLSGSLMYSEDGKVPTEKAIFLGTNSLGQAAVGDKKQYTIKALKQLPNGEHTKVQKIEPIRINNLDGYEIIAQGKNKQLADELVYQVMLYTDESEYFMLVGLASTNQEKNLVAFKKLARSFKRK
jgi:hypothetical protein